MVARKGDGPRTFRVASKKRKLGAGISIGAPVRGTPSQTRRCQPARGATAAGGRRTGRRAARRCSWGSPDPGAAQARETPNRVTIRMVFVARSRPIWPIFARRRAALGRRSLGLILRSYPPPPVSQFCREHRRPGTGAGAELHGRGGVPHRLRRDVDGAVADADHQQPLACHAVLLGALVVPGRGAAGPRPPDTSLLPPTVREKEQVGGGRTPPTVQRGGDIPLT